MLTLWFPKQRMTKVFSDEVYKFTLKGVSKRSKGSLNLFVLRIGSNENGKRDWGPLCRWFDVDSTVSKLKNE